MKKILFVGLIALMVLLAVPAVMADDSVEVTAFTQTVTTTVDCPSGMTFPSMLIDGAEQMVTDNCVVTSATQPWRLTVSDAVSGHDGHMKGKLGAYLINPVIVYDQVSSSRQSLGAPVRFCEGTTTGPTDTTACVLTLYAKAVSGDNDDVYTITTNVVWSSLI